MERQTDRKKEKEIENKHTREENECDKTVTHCNTLQHTVTGWPDGYSYGIRLQHTVTHCHSTQCNGLA